MVPRSEVGRYGSTATKGHRGIPEGAQNRRGTGSGESSSAYETVGVYFHASSRISSWEQYRQVFAAIACSNGWSPTTAALQLFAHLDGEALNVALLMPVEEWEQWTVLWRGLSSYFNSPGRLVAVRWRFESASRRQGVDPATELGILAVRGFGNMGERARGLME